jgi:hypothetical protein
MMGRPRAWPLIIKDSRSVLDVEGKVGQENNMDGLTYD